jgi:hypothetical protein
MAVGKRERVGRAFAFDADDTYRALDLIEPALVAVDAEEADAVWRDASMAAWCCDRIG